MLRNDRGAKRMSIILYWDGYPAVYKRSFCRRVFLYPEENNWGTVKYAVNCHLCGELSCTDKTFVFISAVYLSIWWRYTAFLN